MVLKPKKAAPGRFFATPDRNVGGCLRQTSIFPNYHRIYR